MKESEGGRTLETTERSIAIVDVIRRLEGASLSELDEHLDIAKSTIHNHLATLVKLGYLKKQGGEYDLGMKYINLGEYVKSHQQGYGVVRKQVEQLAKDTEEEVSFEVMDRGRLLIIYGSYTSPSEKRRTGSYHYMHNTACGKAILAELPRQRIHEIVDEWGLSASTDNTIDSTDTLFNEIEETRKRGFAINDEEFIEGLRAVGEVVENFDGSVFGAIAISGPGYRIENDRLNRELPDALHSTVADIEDELSPLQQN